MNDMFSFGGRIMMAAAVSALILGGVHSVATPLITGQRHKELQSSLQRLLPEATTFKTIITSGNIPAFHGLDTKGELKGYILQTSGKGYSSTITSLVAVSPTGTILGVEVLDQQETPGLGTRITEIRSGEKQPWFTAQFIGKKREELALKKDGGHIDAITGATISSRAMTAMLDKALRTIPIQKKERP